MILIAFIAGVFFDRWLVERTSSAEPATQEYETLSPGTWLSHESRYWHEAEAARRAAEQ